MDTFLGFFTPNVIPQVKKVPTGTVAGRVVVEDEEVNNLTEDMFHVDEDPIYPRGYQKKELQSYELHFQKQKDGTMSNIESLGDMFTGERMEAVRENCDERKKEIYATYHFDQNLRKEKMPIDTIKKDILDVIASTSALIIRGPTGCGKTTQVPQFILDDAREKNTFCNVIVTQPRRLAAVSVAKRVCEERCWQLGSICGYQVGLENVTSPDTILTYVTTGVLLQKLINQKNLNDYTHILIDEVHERTQEMDFLLLLVRRYIKTNSPSVKVILMSATFDTDKFAYYLRSHGTEFTVPAPTLHVDKESKHKLYLFYLEQLLQGPNSIISSFNIDEPEVKPEMINMMIYLIKIFEKIDKIDPVTGKKEIGHVLVFLPGYFEIEEAYNKLVQSRRLTEINTEWLILPLHSMNTSAEQQKVFVQAGPNQRKIILSTNIAESSLTLSDIEYVIDFCLTKTLVVDPMTRYPSLKLMWASKVNCNQRSGRVGRVKDGRVYRLIPQDFYEKELPKEITPEMLTAPLERVVLGAKLLEIEQPPKSILALAIDPPKLDDIHSTILNLKEAGALLLTCNGTYNRSDGDLTFLGRIMCSLPLDIKLSKLIVLGYMFNCMDDCIIMAAGCSLTNIFKIPFQERLQSYNNKLMWADGSSSDLIAYLNLYKVWEKNKSSGSFRNNRERDWCRNYYLSNKALREWDTLVNELRRRLHGLGIKEVLGPGRVILSPVELSVVVKIAICGAFYPNYFRRAKENGEGLERQALREVNGLNPTHTVYYTNMEFGQPGPLYAKQIKQALKKCSSNIEVHFDISSKVYVSFKEPVAPQTVTINGEQFVTAMPGKIPPSVYKAVKIRQLKIPTVVYLLKPDYAWKFAESRGIARKNTVDEYELINKPIEMKSNALPSLNDITIRLRICQVIDAGHFYAQPISDEVERNISLIDDILNYEDDLQKLTGKPEIDKWYAAKYEDGRFYRCKILGVAPGNKNSTFYQILFFDFGDILEISHSLLYEIPKGEALKIPPQAIECILSEVQPSVMNSNGLWSAEANEILSKKKLDNVFNAKVYSVVDNIVSLELYIKNEKMSFNKWLIEKGYAQHAEESLLSKEDNEKRLKTQQFYEPGYSDFSEKHYLSICEDVEPPSIDECPTKLVLKGPFSPLEMKVHCMTDSHKITTIDGNSVNSVLLDADPQDNHERLLVAACIVQSPHSRNLTLRDTTMMPNIHGLPMLMALLFCPRMAPKPTPDGTQLSAILCGLGESDLTAKPIYEEHDIVVYLDTELTCEDMQDINEFRFWLNKTVECMEITAGKSNPDIRIEVCQRELHTRIFKLLCKPRKSQELTYVNHASNWHRFEYNGEKLLPGETNMKNEIWPLLWTMALEEEKHEQSVIEDLSSISMNAKPLTEMTCNICNIHIYSASEKRSHLESASHIAAEKKLSLLNRA